MLALSFIHNNKNNLIAKVSVIPQMSPIWRWSVMEGGLRERGLTQQKTWEENQGSLRVEDPTFTERELQREYLALPEIPCPKPCTVPSCQFYMRFY